MTTTAHANTAQPVLAAFDDVPLKPHASGDTGPVQTLSVSGSLLHSGVLALDFRLSADLQKLRFVPSVCHAQRRDELWRHTCFELFARRAHERSYCEFNFTPSGDWAAYAFDDYRGTRQDAAQQRIDVTMQTLGAGQVNLRARIDLGAAYAIDAAALELTHWQLNCAAVIESNDGALGYWAAHHPRPQPDFHDAAGFVVSLNGAPR